MSGKEIMLRSEQAGMLKLLIPGEQQYVMGEWMVDFADGKLKWRMWMKALHCQILQYFSSPFSFWVKGTQWVQYRVFRSEVW